MSSAGAAVPGQTGPAGIESGNDDRITLDDAARLLFVLRRHAVELLAPDRNGPADGARQPSSVFRADVLRCRDVHGRGRRYGLSVVCCKRGRGRAEGGMPV